jgi:secreted PhoX family phosphatase
MTDGFPTPGAHDGMAAFPLPNGNIRLIRNHELSLQEHSGTVPLPAYDPKASGGTTSLEIDPASREVVSDFTSLSGTVRNCPWGSWLSCEETVVGSAEGATRPHGYVFEVPVDTVGPVDPIPLKAMGRFVHEAVAVDPATGIVYETEDQQRAGLYRFIPQRPYSDGRPADLAAGGRLQMLAIRDRPNYDCSRRQTAGSTLPVTWVDIDNPDPADAETNPAAVFEQGWAAGGARFTRVEGCWFGDGSVYFSCTDGGDAEHGQIWRYRPAENGGELTLIFESPSSKILDHPDNVCVSPRGGIVVCEDGDPRIYVRGLTPDGRLFDFASNITNDSEFAGATFSPDGQTLFLNIQYDPGATFAIWGPWVSCPRRSPSSAMTSERSGVNAIPSGWRCLCFRSPRI